MVFLQQNFSAIYVRVYYTCVIQALEHIKHRVSGLSTNTGLDLLNYPKLDQLTTGCVDKMAICQLFHWAAVKYSHQEGLKAKPLQKVSGHQHSVFAQ